MLLFLLNRIQPNHRWPRSPRCKLRCSTATIGFVYHIITVSACQITHLLSMYEIFCRKRWSSVAYAAILTYSRSTGNCYFNAFIGLSYTASTALPFTFDFGISLGLKFRYMAPKGNICLVPRLHLCYTNCTLMLVHQSQNSFRRTIWT